VNTTSAVRFSSNTYCDLFQPSDYLLGVTELESSGGMSVDRLAIVSDREAQTTAPNASIRISPRCLCVAFLDHARHTSDVRGACTIGFMLPAAWSSREGLSCPLLPVRWSRPSETTPFL
jgi:hypothetical protein